MHWFSIPAPRVAKVITGRNLGPRATAFACAAIASFGFASGTLKAQGVSDQADCGSDRRPKAHHATSNWGRACCTTTNRGKSMCRKCLTRSAALVLLGSALSVAGGAPAKNPIANHHGSGARGRREPLTRNGAGTEPAGLGVRNIRGAGRVGPIRIAGDPRRFGFRPQCVSAHQPAFVDRVLQLRSK
jgi:hypothetical protein